MGNKQPLGFISLSGVCSACPAGREDSPKALEVSDTSEQLRHGVGVRGGQAAVGPNNRKWTYFHQKVTWSFALFKTKVLWLPSEPLPYSNGRHLLWDTYPSTHGED